MFDEVTHKIVKYLDLGENFKLTVFELTVADLYT